MVTKSQKIRLGVFLTVCFLLLAISLIVVTGKKMMQQKKTYFIRYRDVSLTGLEVGSQVKYQGIRIGQVVSIDIDPDDISSLVVTIDIKEKVPIKTNTEAMLSVIGITGLKQIELRGGTNAADELSPDAFIEPGQSLIETLSGSAEEIAQKVERVLNNLLNMTGPMQQAEVSELIKNASAALENINGLISDNREDIQQTIAAASNVAEQLDSLVSETHATMAGVNQLLNSTDVQKTVVNVHKITDELARVPYTQLVGELSAAIAQTRKTVTHADLTLLKGRQDLLSSIETLKEAMENINEFSRIISENPSVLLYRSQQKEIKD